LRLQTESGRTAGRTRHENRSEGGIPDADLAALVAAWPTLPVHIRAAIRALLASAQVLPNDRTNVERPGNSRQS
jgi:hypothetical protein